MSNQTAGRSVITYEDTRLRRYGNPAPASLTTLYPGQMMGTDESIYAKNIDDTAKMWLRGILTANANVILQTTDAADKYQIEVARKPFLATMSSPAAADTWKTVFISDNQTVSLSPGTYGNLAGWIEKYLNSTQVMVTPPENPRGGMACGPYRGIRTLAATGAETLTYLDLNTIILIPNTATKAVTLMADAKVAYGDRLFFIKTHASDANAITLTAATAQIDGAATYAGMDAHHDSVELMYMGATIGWCRIGGVIH